MPWQQNPAYDLLPFFSARWRPGRLEHVLVSSELEFVWVVRRRDLFPKRSPHGFEVLSPPELDDRYLDCIHDRGFFVERREAECCPEWKQVIPYCVVRWEGSFLLLERLGAQSEARLHGLYSLGVGGHINPQDRSPGGDLVMNAAWREIREEILVSEARPIEAVGIINDDSTEVGAVHVGIVFSLRAQGPEPRIKEEIQHKAILTPLAELQDMCSDLRRFETWTAEILATPDWSDRF